jgi:hypothetical protein
MLCNVLCRGELLRKYKIQALDEHGEITNLVSTLRLQKQRLALKIMLGCSISILAEKNSQPDITYPRNPMQL